MSVGGLVIIKNGREVTHFNAPIGALVFYGAQTDEKPSTVFFCWSVIILPLSVAYGIFYKRKFIFKAIKML